MAEEKKTDYGKTQVQFTVSANVSGAQSANFLVISRMKNPGQYKPVLKSETKPLHQGKINWNRIILDTDTLCEGNNSQPILF